MSFGFGFALPAYPLRGGGGNNPFNQSGPTLDLSFAGVVTDLSDPNGYTLNTNFIVPQYQIAAQYLIWETGVGLVDKTFSQIITFTRASGATWFNSTGTLVGVDFSTSSNTIGTGSKTFTLDATAGVDRSWATGDTVLISDQANSANNMTGTVTSYTASTQVLVVNITASAGSGTITSWRVGSTMPRFDYNPSTLAAQGLLIEEARTNSIRNNTMQGAAAGTPGTQPTNWAIQSPNAGLTREIVGIGTQNGIAYIDVRFSGTTTGTSANLVFFEPNAAVAALNGQTWTGTAWIALVGGSFANINIMNLTQRFNDAAGVSLTIAATSILAATPSMSRYSITSTASNASTAFVTSLINASFANGAAIDITLRIGLPQLEQGAFATSVIPTTTTALTRSADVASVNTLSPWFNATEGTLLVEAQHYAPSAATQQWQLQLASASTNYYGIYKESSPANMTIRIRSGGVDQAFAYTTGAISANTTYKTALGYAVNDVAACTNGGSVFTDNTVTLPTSVTSLGLGQPTYTTSVPLNGYLRRVTYYPRKFSSAELQAITA